MILRYLPLGITILLGLHGFVWAPPEGTPLELPCERRGSCVLLAAGIRPARPARLHEPRELFQHCRRHQRRRDDRRHELRAQRGDARRGLEAPRVAGP